MEQATTTSYVLLVVIGLINLCGSMYTDTWAVHITGDHRRARALADKHGFIFEGEIIPDFYQFRHKRVVRRSAEPSNHLHIPLTEESDVKWVEQQYVKRRVKRSIIENDPMWPKMWYLNREGCTDMNVLRAWRMGYTGKGSVVTILDDGIEKNHPDLKDNYDPEASYDINDSDPDPQPRYDIFNYNRHGTRCAGEVAAVANNSICSVGIAPRAGIGGIRMLDGDITDAVEARSIGFNQQHIDIYSASWGPDDDGRTVDGPGLLAKHAFKTGITSGRRGLGNIFVWASGNGGRQGDSCSCDGYTNSIYTLSVSSASERGTVPWYSEPCASTLATTYSSGSGADRMIMTTDLRLKCTERHTGTSASAPLAAGVVAVVLEANNKLTWRDIQHITVRTANAAHLLSSDWVENGVGLKVSHSFGFGMMDTAAMVDMAKNWTTAPVASLCHVPVSSDAQTIAQNKPFVASATTDACNGTSQEIKYLEHVQVKLTLGATKRGGVSIFIVSPSGTKSTLLKKRSRDFHGEGFKDWEFLTVHSWGESPVGKWTLEIQSQTTNTVLESWSLIFHGTKTLPGPGPYQNKPNDCDFRLKAPIARSPSPAPGMLNKSPNIVVEPPINSLSGSTRTKSGPGYYESCDPSKLNCAPNMVCIPSEEDHKIYVCNCLPTLVYSRISEVCEHQQSIIPPKAQIDKEGGEIKEQKIKPNKLITTPIILVISGVLAVLIIGAIVMFIVFKCKSYQKYGKYKNMGEAEMLSYERSDVSHLPDYRM